MGLLRLISNKGVIMRLNVMYYISDYARSMATLTGTRNSIIKQGDKLAKKHSLCAYSILEDYIPWRTYKERYLKETGDIRESRILTPS